MLSDLPKYRLPPAFGNEHDELSYSPIDGITFVCFGGSRFGVSSMGERGAARAYSRNCHTSNASPGRAGRTPLVNSHIFAILHCARANYSVSAVLYRVTGTLFCAALDLALRSPSRFQKSARNLLLNQTFQNHSVLR